MNIENALGLAKDYAEKYTRSFVDFFRGGEIPLGEGETPYQHIVSGALIYLVIGVTLQDSFISGIRIDNISWLDRALVQIVFWITIALVLQLLLRIFAGVGTGAALVTLRVMPIAFLAGAYAAALGAFTALGLRLVHVEFPLPHVFHIVVQLIVIALYMPRELRVHSAQGRIGSRCLTALVFAIVLFVDFIVVFGSAFVDAPTQSLRGR